MRNKARLAAEVTSTPSQGGQGECCKEPQVRVEAAFAQLPTAGTTAARVKSFSDPWGLNSKRVATPRPDAEMEGAVAAATDRSRSFLNRSGNHWYTPRGTSG